MWECHGEDCAGIADSGDIDVRSYDMVTADACRRCRRIAFADECCWHAHHHCRGAASIWII